MNKMKKFFSLALVAALTFTMNMTTFAQAAPPENERPVESVDAMVSGLDSVTIGNTSASIVQDINAGGDTEDQVYARATLPSGSTEYALRHQTVTIESSEAVQWDGTPVQAVDGKYVISSVDLFNKAYTLTIGTGDDATNVLVAAGLEASENLPVAEDDTLKVSDLKLVGLDTKLNVTNTVNPYYANDYYENENGNWEWNSIIYQFVLANNAKLPSTTDLAKVSGTMTVAANATVSGVATGSNGNYTFDLSGANPNFIVTNGNDTRTYYVAAEVATSGIQVTYAIDLTEVVTDSTYSTQYAKNCTEILNGAEGYFNSVGAANVTKTNKSVSAVITVPTGTDAMQPMLDLTAWATSNGKFTGTTKNNGGYLATLDGLGEFSCGQMSGWMYTDDSRGYFDKVTGPGVGAASYTMTNGQKITWYMTTNYFNHF